MIRLKRGQNPFFGPTFGPQTPKYPKSIPREPLVVESWLTAYMTARFDLLMGVLRYVYLSDNRKYPKNTIFFFGPYMMKFQNFPYHKNYISN